MGASAELISGVPPEKPAAKRSTTETLPSTTYPEQAQRGSTTTSAPGANIYVGHTAQTTQPGQTTTAAGNGKNQVEPIDSVEIRFPNLSLKNIKQGIFAEELFQALREYGAHPDDLHRVEIQLREGSVIANIRGPHSVIARLRALHLEGITVKGDTGHVIIHPAPLPTAIPLKKVPGGSTSTWYDWPWPNKTRVTTTGSARSTLAPSTSTTTTTFTTSTTKSTTAETTTSETTTAATATTAITGSDCTNMGGVDCASTLGEWAGAGTCVAHLNPPGGKFTCNNLCTQKGRHCIKANRNWGKRVCEISSWEMDAWKPGGKKWNDPDKGCNGKYLEQICVCSKDTTETTGTSTSMIGTSKSSTTTRSPRSTTEPRGSTLPKRTTAAPDAEAEKEAEGEDEASTTRPGQTAQSMKKSTTPRPTTSEQGTEPRPQPLPKPTTAAPGASTKHARRKAEAERDGETKGEVEEKGEASTSRPGQTAQSLKKSTTTAAPSSKTGGARNKVADQDEEEEEKQDDETDEEGEGGTAQEEKEQAGTTMPSKKGLSGQPIAHPTSSPGGRKSQPEQTTAAGSASTPGTHPAPAHAPPRPAHAPPLTTASPSTMSREGTTQTTRTSPAPQTPTTAHAPSETSAAHMPTKAHATPMTPEAFSTTAVPASPGQATQPLETTATPDTGKIPQGQTTTASPSHTSRAIPKKTHAPPKPAHAPPNQPLSTTAAPGPITSANATVTVPTPAAPGSNKSQPRNVADSKSYGGDATGQGNATAAPNESQAQPGNATIHGNTSAARSKYKSQPGNTTPHGNAAAASRANASHPTWTTAVPTTTTTTTTGLEMSTTQWNMSNFTATTSKPDVPTLPPPGIQQ
eukprot:gnl/TRDRNA2_/TRDRNA2_152985_c1_seq1.p1 gnl/TRDRNA2_/TRDRNA2_152985_c1~~gnl/TRDRNA2_/TRDRNA2_152985_c1_seq1.p1  ORF type:complete len:878 (-),score=93.21 gnl/TRDRNA2_/TRDRNA2_152985_c1_seq1:351-2927(-)